MTTSSVTSSFRLIKIDEALRKDHCYLTVDDECYCLGEYTPRGNYTAGPVNNLIFNFKKPVDRKGLPQYRYKTNAIREVAGHISKVLRPETAQYSLFVPIPPSKHKTDPLYDDRMTQALQAVPQRLNIRELVESTVSTKAHHEMAEGEPRPGPDALYKTLAINRALLTNLPSNKIVLVDDILTNGTHFKACKRLIQEHIPGCEVIGLFIGRCKWPDVDLSAIFG